MNSRIFLATLISLALSPLTVFGKDGGLGNGTDLYRCDVAGKTTYELLDLFEAGLRKQAPDFAPGLSAENILQVMADRHATRDPYLSAVILAEGAKVLADIRALAAGRTPSNPVVAAADGELEPGPDAGRNTHPAHCQPIRLIEQATDVSQKGIRYRVDLNLVKHVGETSLGISAYHEGLYKVLLGLGVRSSIGVRAMAATVFSGEISKLGLPAYLREISAIGVTEYRIGDESIAADPQKSGIAAARFGNFYEVMAKNPVSQFGLKFDRLVFSEKTDRVFRSAIYERQKLQVTPGQVPTVKRDRTSGEVRALWFKSPTENTLQIGDSAFQDWTEGHFIARDLKVVLLDSVDRVSAGTDTVESMPKTARKAWANYFDCWRNRLLRADVNRYDLRTFEVSFNHLVRNQTVEANEVEAEGNECRSRPIAAADERHFEALKNLRETEAVHGPAKQIVDALLSRRENCSVDRFVATAAFGGGVGVNYARYTCHDFAGYSRKFIGAGPGVGVGFGGAFKREQFTVERTSKGDDSRMKALVTLRPALNAFGNETDGNEDGRTGTGGGLEFTLIAHSAFGVRTATTQDEHLFLSYVVNHANALVKEQHRLMKENRSPFDP